MEARRVLTSRLNKRRLDNVFGTITLVTGPGQLGVVSFCQETDEHHPSNWAFTARMVDGHIVGMQDYSFACQAMKAAKIPVHIRS